MKLKMKYQILLAVACISLMLLQPSSAIVNGVNTGVNEFKMMAGLVQLPLPFVFCGGTILSNLFVLTAAHCVLGRIPASVVVLVALDTPYSAVYIVQNFVFHPSYNATNRLNDIAIIRTLTSIQFNAGVGPVCLPPTDLSFTDSSVQLVGWGNIMNGGPVSSTLRKVQVNVISNSECNTFYEYIQDSHMCTYYSGRDSCQFDSGGPVYSTLDGPVNIAGIIITGSSCATSYPSVNTRVTSFIPWIVEKTNGSVCLN